MIKPFRKPSAFWMSASDLRNNATDEARTAGQDYHIGCGANLL